MAKRGYRKCAGCSEFINPEEDYYEYADHGALEGKILCENCVQSEGEDVTPVIFCESSGYANDGAARYQYDVSDNLIISHDGYDQSERHKEVEEYARSIGWHSTDAWRGYIEGHAPDGFVNVIDTWFCGLDGANVTGVLEAFQKHWDQNKENPDFEMLVAFPRTSNVCTCGIEVYVRAGVQNRFYEWLGVTEDGEPVQAPQEDIEEEEVNVA